MTLPDDFDAIGRARVPAAALAALSDLRREPRLTVAFDAEGFAWLSWPAGPRAGRLARRVLPLPGAELFELRDGLWHRFGARLPAFDLPHPTREAPLHQELLPSPFTAEPPEAEPSKAVTIALTRDDRPRLTTAMLATAADLARWADLAPSQSIAALRGAWDPVRKRVLVLGSPPPPIAGPRFWGDRVLTPLGHRPEPALPEPTLLAAARATDDGRLVLSRDGFECVPLKAFRGLSRASIRLAAAPAKAEGAR
jgi:hypothetical protein